MYTMPVVTKQTNFRLGTRDLLSLERMAAELVCSRTDVIRHGLAALRANPGLRDAIKVEQLAQVFLSRLRARHGDNALLEFEISHPMVEATINQHPIDPTELQIKARTENDGIFIDLIDPTAGVGILNAYWTQDADTHVTLPLNALNVYRRMLARIEPIEHIFHDGRTAVVFEEDDGQIRTIVLSPDGTSSPLSEEQKAHWIT